MDSDEVVINLIQAEEEAYIANFVLAQEGEEDIVISPNGGDEVPKSIYFGGCCWG